jgi:RimJ/RimL family protein N-acetyltransferase
VAERLNKLGQPIGPGMPDDWNGCEPPPRKVTVGQYCRLVPFVLADHAEPLYKAFSCDDSDANWTYLSYGPFDSLETFRDWLQESCTGDDPMFFVFEEVASGEVVGMAAFMNIKSALGSIEVGNVHFSNAMQRTPVATEAMYLMMVNAFDELGYRRYEWKCDALNARSRKAAKRLGFSYEGVFRQAMIYKGRSRDTAWFAMVDNEWDKVKEAYLAWLDPANFDEAGIQRQRLLVELP